MVCALGAVERIYELLTSYNFYLERSLMQSGLVSAYKATEYVAHGDCWVVVIRIGHHSLAVDRLLVRMHARSGAFITASNPFSKDLGSAANKHWDLTLKRYLRVFGF